MRVRKSPIGNRSVYFSLVEKSGASFTGQSQNEVIQNQGKRNALSNTFLFPFFPKVENTNLTGCGQQ